MHTNDSRRRRFGWIEAALRYSGCFGPSEKIIYADIFCLSEPTVSRDQSNFAEIFETALGRSVFQRTEEGALKQRCLILMEDVDLPDEGIFDSIPSAERWIEDALGGRFFHEEGIRRTVPHPDIVRHVVSAIQNRRVLEINYHSRASTSQRIISPNAIVKVVGRMHVRAYDHGKQSYRDFVLSRIVDAKFSASECIYKSLVEDRDWQTYERVLIQEAESSNAYTNTGVRLDFDLNEQGQRTIKTRRALVPYLIDDPHPGYRHPVKVKKISRK